MGDALHKIVLTKSGETTQTYDNDASTNRIIDLKHWEGDWFQTAEVIIDDREGNVSSINLVGYQGVISYGYRTGAGDEYAGMAPLKVIVQRLDYLPDQVCVLSLSGKGNQMAEDKASGVQKKGTATSTLADHLVDSAATFVLSDVGHTIHNTTDDTAAKITGFNSATDVTLSADIMVSGEAYSVVYNMGYDPPATNTDTVKTLIAAICGATMPCFSHCDVVTVVWDVEDDLVDTFKPADTFKVYTGQNRKEKVQELLSHTGLDSRFEVDGYLHILETFARAWQKDFNYYTDEIVRSTVFPGAGHGDYIYKCTTSGVSGSTEPTWTTLPGDTIGDGSVVWTLEYDYTYAIESDDHNIYQKSTRIRIVSPNKIIVMSHPDQEGTYIGVATEPISYAELPKEETIYLRLTSNTEAEDIAKAKIDRLRRDSSEGHGYVPMNVGAEVHDYVLIAEED